MSDTKASYYLEDLVLEQSYEQSFSMTQERIMAFADVSEDHNPVHIDPDYAATTAFKGPIAHGALAGAFISAALASGLPGRGSIYVSQSLQFKRAIRPGDEVVVRLKVSSIDLKTAHVVLDTKVLVKNKTMVDGQAEVIAPRKPVDA